MAKKIQIICTKPGMRRAGVEHPQMATYDLDHWSEEDLQKIKDDPAFVVQEIDEDATVVSNAEMEAEVARRVKEELAKFEVTYRAEFDGAVGAAVKAQFKETNAEMVKMVDRIKELETELAEARAAKAGQKK